MPYIIVGVVVLLVIILFFYVVSKRNRFVVMLENIRNAFAQIDVQLKRRYDLIPNLVNTVKGYAAHESGTLEQVVALRNQAAAASTDQEKIQLNNQLSGALSRLLVTVEAYPELKANANFLDLQNQLKDTEQKIAISRQIYNDSVTKYNRALQMFPGNIVASMFHYERKEYLEAADTERQNVKVEF